MPVRAASARPVRALRLQHAVPVGLSLAEVDRVERGHAPVGLAEGALIENAHHALAGAHVEMVPAGVANAVALVAAGLRKVGLTGEAAGKPLIPGTVSGIITAKQSPKRHTCECIKCPRRRLCPRALPGIHPRSWGRGLLPAPVPTMRRSAFRKPHIQAALEERRRETRVAAGEVACIVEQGVHPPRPQCHRCRSGR